MLLSRLGFLPLLLALAPAALAQQQGPPGPASVTSPGVVLDREGSAARRAVGEARWGPVDERDRLRAGDWLKTGSRGANALAVTLGDGGSLILGPGAQVEVMDATAVVVHTGEVEVAPGKGAKVSVAGPAGGAKTEVTAATVLRADPKARTLTKVSEPRWLTGYKAASPTEAVGSLLATVDGRNVPLTLGYHSVTVDVRDQIARTTIEERFVNRTGVVLEGVFYFPLPSDASISGFGMWIGDELVHGEIVEKERARAIYETILREKRDPGLLEWAGGSIFKARVYPIFAEKRIQIVYTQVLRQTRRADGACVLRYTHPLQSELLRATPLERLEVRATVSSARPLLDVRSLTHEGRLERTEHSARFELSREQFSPDRDLELELVTAAPASARAGGGGITVIPHRRGDDGYLLLQVDAPTTAPATGASRDAPLDLLVVADTSGSTLGPARAAQTAFVAALLDALSEKDAVNLVACDVKTVWAFDRAQPCTPAARETALGTLEARTPLGWTDLDLVFQQVAARVGPTTQVVYVGDGAPTSGDGDAAALATRLERLLQGKTTVHAVVPGTTAEPIVLRAMSRGGSLRTLETSDPARGAFELLAELTAPAVKDLALRFEGVEVAAIHPTPLPNLPLGAQHVVTARFDPRALKPDAKGRVVLTGTLGGQRFETATDLVLTPTEGSPGSDPASDASFIPRLWAKGHLDELLTQGTAPITKARVIALSEEFQIVSPYTSFLVLESDADRERFQVKKRTRMRDGEEFFAEGQARAGHDLARAQLQKAKGWRLELEARALALLADLNRGATGRLAGGYLAGGAGGGGVALGLAQSPRRMQRALREELAFDGAPAPATPAPTAAAPMEAPAGEDESSGEGDAERDSDGPAAQPEAPEEAEADDRSADKGEAKQDMAKAKRAPMAGRASANSMEAIVDGRFRRGYVAQPSATPALFLGDGYGLVPARPLFTPGGPVEAPANPWDGQLPAPGGPRASVAAPGSTSWPAAVADALRSLDRRGATGVRIVTTLQAPDGRGRPLDQGEARLLLGQGAWLQTSRHREGEAVGVERLLQGQREAWALPWALGRRRPAVEGDARAWDAPYGWAFGDEPQALTEYTAELSTPAQFGRGLLRFVLPADARLGRVEQVLELELDVVKGVVLAARSFTAGQLVETTTWADHVQVAGAWWPKTETRTRGTWSSKLTITVEPLAPDAVAAEARAHGREGALLLGPGPASLEVARRAAEQGKAGLEERWALLGQLWAAGRWDEAAPHADAVEQALAGKPGLALVRALRLAESRRLEELKVHLTAAAKAVAAAPAAPADVAAALQLVQLGGYLGQNELLALLDLAGPVAERRPGLVDARAQLAYQRIYALRGVGREVEALAAMRALVAALPERLDVHTQLAQLLEAQDDREGAVAALDEALAKHGPWPLHERRALVTTALHTLWNGQRFELLLERLERLEREDAELLDAQLLGRRLTALLMLDREDAAWALAKSWAALELPAKGEVPPVLAARLQAVVNHALGQNEMFYVNQVEEERALLALEVARRVVGHPALGHLAQQVLGHWQVLQLEPAKALARELFARLRAQAATLEPGALQQLVVLCQQSRHAAADPTVETEAAWRAIFEAIHARWERAALPQGQEKADPEAEAALGQLLDGWGGPELGLRRLRLLHARAHARWTASHTFEDLSARRDVARSLVEALLAAPRTGADADALAEVQALALLCGPLEGEAPAAQSAAISQQVLLFGRLVDWLTTGRAEAVVAALPDVNALPRRKLEAARTAALREARLAAIATIDQWLGLLGKTAPGSADLAGWLEADRAWLRVKLRRDVDQARAWAEAALKAAIAARTDAAREPTPRERLLASRALATLLQLVALEKADARGPRVAAVLETVAPQAAKGDRLLDWREAELVARLLAQDLAGLDAALTAWVASSDVQGASAEQVAEGARWARPLAWILVERDQLARAAAVVTRLDERGAAGHQDLRLLVDWFTALDQRPQADAARRRSWELADEWTIAAALQQDVQKVSRSGEQVPEPLDPEAPVRVTVLLAKATSPAQHVWVIQQLYQTTRDFRLLEGLADACVGQSVERVYDLLQGIRQVTDSIQEEATLDQLGQRIAAVRTKARTDVDRRALQLLEFTARRRAAEQANGAGPHLAAALEALRGAWKGEWQAGERVLLARFLVNQGTLQPALGQEQVRQLTELLAATAVGSLERLELAGALATLQGGYGDQPAALRTLSGAVQAVRQQNAGGVPPSNWQQVDQLVSLLQQQGDWRGAEKELEVELAAPHPRGHLQTVTQRRLALWIDAVAEGAEVSLGRGKRLYDAVRDALLRALAQRTTEGEAYQSLSMLVQLCLRANGRRELGAAPRDDLQRFAFSDLPKVLALYQGRSGSGMTQQVASALEQLAGPLPALELLVVRMESEPRWLRLLRQDLWSQSSWQVANLRSRVGRLPDGLAARLLTIVVRRLQAELVQPYHGNTAMTWRHSSDFWAEKAADFAQATREVVASRPKAEGVAVRAATYLHDGLGLEPEAIALLLERANGAALGTEGRALLAEWLLQASRWKEALPLVEALVKEQPGDVQHRRRLMLAAHGLGQRGLVVKARKDAEAYLREVKAWSEGAVVTLADACTTVGLGEDAAALWREAIELHVKQNPDTRGNGDGSLASYYGRLADALSLLGRTDEAIDAACGAVLAWGRSVDQRQYARDALVRTLVAAKDLEAYGKRLDAQVDKDGLENPILRQALGKAWLERGNAAEAERHLVRAVDVASNDAETVRLLVQALDQQGRGAEAADRLLGAALSQGHDIGLWKDVAARFEKAGRPDDAERAWTMIVEQLPNESESHQALAERLEATKRLPEALVQWRAVVRARSDDPTGWLSLGQALQRAGEKAELQDVIRKLRTTTWEPRFGDLSEKIDALQRTR